MPRAVQQHLALALRATVLLTIGQSTNITDTVHGRMKSHAACAVNPIETVFSEPFATCWMGGNYCAYPLQQSQLCSDMSLCHAAHSGEE